MADPTLDPILILTPFTAIQAVGVTGGLVVGGLQTRSLVTRGLGDLGSLLDVGYSGPFVAGGAYQIPGAMGAAAPLITSGVRSRNLATRGLGNLGPLAVAGAAGPFLPAAAPLPALVRTSLDQIMAGARRAVLLANLVPSGVAVRFSRNTQPVPDAGYPQIILSRGSFRPIDTHQRGAGRAVPSYEGTFGVTLLTMNASDQAGQDSFRLLGAAAPPVGLIDPYGHATTPDLTLADQFAGAPGAPPLPFDPSAAVFVPGLETLVHRLVALLTLDFLEDPLGNHLTAEPLTLVGNPAALTFADAPMWEGFTLTFHAIYLARLGIFA